MFSLCPPRCPSRAKIARPCGPAARAIGQQAGRRPAGWASNDRRRPARCPSGRVSPLLYRCCCGGIIWPRAAFTSQVRAYFHSLLHSELREKLSRKTKELLYGGSRSVKVIEIGTDRKPKCDFLGVFHY